MNANVPGFRRLLDSLYDSMSDAEPWRDFLAGACERVGCESGAIASHDFENRAPEIVCARGLPAGQVDEWNNYYGKRQPRTLEIRQTILRRGSSISAMSLRDLPRAYRSTEYVEWLDGRDSHHSLILAVPVGRGFLSVSFTRSRTDRPFSSVAVKLMERLVPHVSRVARVHERTESVMERCQAASSALDTLDRAVIAVDRRGRVLWMNTSADAILRNNRGLGLRDDRLVADRTSDNRDLERVLTMIAGTGTSTRSARVGAVTIQGHASAPRLSVVVRPLEPRRPSSPLRPGALIFIHDPAAKPATRATLLRELFRLTPAEARLADLLHDRLDLKRVAEEMRVTPGTARFVLKSVFAKTNTSRQSELLKLLSALPGE